MADVAVAAGVSKALVSIVFRGAAGASEATRARVFHAAEQLGYRTNRTASLLKLHRTRHLGVTMNVRNAFHAELVESIQEAADREGYQIVLSTVTGSHDERRAIETLLEFRCESLILLGSELGKPTLDDLAATVPVVLVGRRIATDSVDVVRTADDKGLGLVIDHLVALGHHHIAHIDGGRHPISADRRRGYRTAMRRHHEDRHVLIVTGGTGEADGWRAADQFDSTRVGGATVVAAYSPRIRPGAPVSFPVGWEDLDHVVPADFTVHNAAELLDGADPWTDRMPPAQELNADLVAEGHTIPVARVQAMHEGKRRARSRRDS